MAELLLAHIFLLGAFGIVCAHFVNITILETAIAKGAVCYPSGLIAEGMERKLTTATSIYRLIILINKTNNMELQGWWVMSECSDCLARSRSALGSGPKPDNISFDGMLEDNSTFNRGVIISIFDQNFPHFCHVYIQGLTNLLPTSCTSKFSPTLCFFPENLVQDVKTPLFLIESAFDRFQTIARAVSDWFFDRSEFKQMDICNDMPRNCTVFRWHSFLQKCAAWNAIN
ncbi:hypothetical protein SASPL_108645 [Salvia splendens]|uniref:Pectin acetylesterase n=1 Tax=Salvia splendens TaxID=180675 RepID=A0A8X8YCN3_SALSN|nr:hypothetical protein SASPL_108645 [Salvia splendens]